MKKLHATVVSVHAGSNDNLSKDEHASAQVELDGFVGDRNRSFERTNWHGDKQAKGTKRRNERQWSAVSMEELAEIATLMDLSEPLTEVAGAINAGDEATVEVYEPPTWLALSPD